MIELMNNYSPTEVIIFLVIFAIAVKGVISFYEWSRDHLRVLFGKEVKKEQFRQEIDNRIFGVENKINEVATRQHEIVDSIGDIIEKINLLISSDKDHIKAFITEKHHYFCYEQKWIDDYTLDCLEKQFDHYQAENGNSFIEELMEELRDLPKVPPEEE